MKLKAVQKVWSNGEFIEGNSKTVAQTKNKGTEEKAKKNDDKKKYAPKSGKKERTFSKGKSSKKGK